MTKSYLRKLATLGYSIIPVNEEKVPIGKWKAYQIKTRTPDEVEMLSSPFYGIATGHNDIECIDVDLKIFSSLQEQKEWWKEYLNFLQDNIEDFTDKVVIAKTKNAGFHILYKTKIKTGNTKIARLKEYKEAIIESRGPGGYIMVYDNFLFDKGYHDVDYITDKERDIIWSISRTYNYIENVKIDAPKKSEYKATSENDIKLISLLWVSTLMELADASEEIKDALGNYFKDEKVKLSRLNMPQYGIYIVDQEHVFVWWDSWSQSIWEGFAKEKLMVSLEIKD